MPTVRHGDGSRLCGMALEMGEPETHGDFAAFQAAVMARSKLDLSRRTAGEVHFTSARGERVGIRLAKAGLPAVIRSGAEHDWRQHWNLWAGDATTPITLGWQQDELRVRAGGREFRSVLKTGRRNLRQGIAPPDSGHPQFNQHSDDIDYQIEADFSGLVAPGLPNAVIALGEKFGRLVKRRSRARLSINPAAKWSSSPAAKRSGSFLRRFPGPAPWRSPGNPAPSPIAGLQRRKGNREAGETNEAET